MKLLVLCGFLFVFLLCLSAFTVEGHKDKGCYSKLPKLNKKRHKGVYLNTSPMKRRKYCKSCTQLPPPLPPGPLPQLK